MKKIYGIRVMQSSLAVRNGKLLVYEKRELAEADLRSMPDSYTDYDHYEVVEVDLMTSADELQFYKAK